MKTLKIYGPTPLLGEVAVGGSKNAALPILVAASLIPGQVTVGNVPEIRDTSIALGLLSGMGVAVSHPRHGTYELNAEKAAPGAVGEDLARSMRGSVYLLGAMLSRFGEVTLPLPGGCNFGLRPIDCHLAVLRAMGAEITEGESSISARAVRLRGTEFRFPVVSVGATVNALLAAVQAEGRTVLYGTAQEPHVLDLIGFLRAAGAKIRVCGGGVLAVEGVPRLHGCHWRVTSDMIEAGTYLIAAAAAGGEILLRGADAGQLTALLGRLRAVGATVSDGAGGICLRRRVRLMATDIATAPYPGFPTDLQPQMTALLCLASGESRITDTVWDSRFRYAAELRRLGADITVNGNSAICRGVPRLRGGSVTVPDLRAGAALAVAALAAEGESTLSDAAIIDRGYENFAGKLRTLGAKITDGSDF